MKKRLIGLLVVIIFLTGCAADTGAPVPANSLNERFSYQIVEDSLMSKYTLITDTLTGGQYLEVRTVKGVAITPLGD